MKKSSMELVKELILLIEGVEKGSSPPLFLQSL